MTELHPEDKAKLGQVLGMKPSEIVAAAEVSDPDTTAVVVETHDGQRVLLTSTDDGATFDVKPWDGPMPGGFELVGEAGPELQLPAGSVVVDAAAVTGDGVPDGSMETVLAWVGDDAVRAALALEAERLREKPRSTLVGQLETLASA